MKHDHCTLPCEINFIIGCRWLNVSAFSVSKRWRVGLTSAAITGCMYFEFNRGPGISNQPVPRGSEHEQRKV